MINFKQYINESNIDKIKEECKRIDSDIDYSFDDWKKQFIKKTNWKDISLFQNLSENFIEYFKDDVDWDYISIKQKLSESFIKKYKDKINFGWLFYNKHITNEFILNNIQWFINEDIKDFWRLEDKKFKDEFYKYKKLFGK